MRTLNTFTSLLKNLRVCLFTLTITCGILSSEFSFALKEVCTEYYLEANRARIRWAKGTGYPHHLLVKIGEYFTLAFPFRGETVPFGHLKSKFDMIRPTIESLQAFISRHNLSFSHTPSHYVERIHDLLDRATHYKYRQEPHLNPRERAIRDLELVNFTSHPGEIEINFEKGRIIGSLAAVLAHEIGHQIHYENSPTAAKRGCYRSNDVYENNFYLAFREGFAEAMMNSITGIHTYNLPGITYDGAGIKTTPSRSLDNKFKYKRLKEDRYEAMEVVAGIFYDLKRVMPDHYAEALFLKAMKKLDRMVLQKGIYGLKADNFREVLLSEDGGKNRKGIEEIFRVREIPQTVERTGRILSLNGQRIRYPKEVFIHHRDAIETKAFSGKDWQGKYSKETFDHADIEFKVILDRLGNPYRIAQEIVKFEVNRHHVHGDRLLPRLFGNRNKFY